MKRSDQGGEAEGVPAAPMGGAGRTERNLTSLPAGPGQALVLTTNPKLREQLSAAGWRVRVVPIPGGDLTGFAVSGTAGSADLVVVEDALSPLHHADKRAALAVVLRWLRPGGALLLCEPLEPVWAGAGGGVRRAWQRLLHGRIDPHSGPASVQFWCDASQHAGFDQIEATETAGRLTLHATRRKAADGSEAHHASSRE